MKNFAEIDSVLLYLLLFLFCFIIALLILKLKSSVDKMKQAVAKGGAPGLRLGCISVIFLILTLLIFLAILSLTSEYHLYEKERPVAKIAVYAKDNQHLRLTIMQIPTDKNSSPSSLSLSIKRAPWSINIETLRWNNTFSKLGLRPMWRVVSINSNGSLSPVDQISTQKTTLKVWKSFFPLAMQINKLFGFAKINSLSSPKQSDQTNQLYLLIISSEGLRLIRSSSAVDAADFSLQNNLVPQKLSEQRKYPSKDEDIKR